MLLSKLRIDVLLGLLLFLELPAFAQVVLDFLDSVLHQALFVEQNSLIIVALLHVDVPLSGQNFCLFAEVFHHTFIEKLLRFVDFCEGVVELAELDVGSCLIVIVERLVGVQTNGLFVVV
jgi:uncharacterized membrane protein YqhA